MHRRGRRAQGTCTRGRDPVSRSRAAVWCPMTTGLALQLLVTIWDLGRRPTGEPFFLKPCLIPPAPSGSRGVRAAQAAARLRYAQAQRHACCTEKPSALAHTRRGGWGSGLWGGRQCPGRLAPSLPRFCGDPSRGEGSSHLRVLTRLLWPRKEHPLAGQTCVPWRDAPKGVLVTARDTHRSPGTVLTPRKQSLKILVCSLLLHPAAPTHLRQ